MLHQTQGVLYMLPVECSRQPCLRRGLGEGERVGNNNQVGRRGCGPHSPPGERRRKDGHVLASVQPTRPSRRWLHAQFVLDPEGQYPSSRPHPIVAPISRLLSEEHFLLCRPDVPSFSSKNVVTE